MKLPENQSILTIFAHPDDESFGPGGTLAILAETNQVHLICVTDGNSYNTGGNLTQTRANELKTASKMLGVSSIHQLGYKDGHIANTLYHEIADKLITLIDRYQPSILLTYEPHGVSGHLDHVGLSFITSYVFYQSSIPRQLWQFCISTQAAANRHDYFIYFPPGYDPGQVDLKVDITSVFNQKLRAIKAHTSQAHDATRHIKKLRSLPKQELFLIKTK